MKFLLLILFLLAPAFGFSQKDFAKYYNSGQSSEEKGLRAKAVSYYLKAENTAKKSYEKNRVWKALADNYKALSDYNRAADYYSKLLTVYNGENRKKVILNLSDLWILTGQYQKVVDNLENMQDSPDENVRIINLSSAYARLGKFNEAASFLDSVLSDKNNPHYKTALQNKGYILWAQNSFQAADSVLKIAVNLFDSADKNKYISLANLAKVQAEIQNFDTALKNINISVEWLKKNLGEKHFDYIIALRKKAEILRSAKRTGDATRQFKEYFYKERQYVSENFAYMTENERLNFWHSQKPLIDECFSVEDSDPDFLFDVAVFSKSVLNLANKNFAVAASSNPETEELYSKIIIAKTELLSAAPENRTAVQEKIDRLEKEFSEKNPQFKTFVKDCMTDTKSIRQSLKNQNDAVAEIIYYEKDGVMRYAALVLQKNKPVRFVPLFTQNEIENYPLGDFTLEICIKAHTKKYKDLIFSDTLLPHKIWDSIVRDIPKNANLYFVPEGIFYNLAVEYMCPRTDLRLFRLTSSAVLKKPSNSVRKTAFVAGGLDYNDISAVESYIDSLPDRTGSRILNSGGVSYTWQYLQNTKTEADSICAVLESSGSNVLKISGTQGTEDFVKQHLGGAGIAVLSTHGYSFGMPEVKNSYNTADSFSADSSMSSCGLIFSGVNVTSLDSPENRLRQDGCLTGFEISTLDLTKTDLIVLSACSTGLGQVTLSGSYGILRGLKKAGANSVIVSLWEVNDLAARLFMSYFFDFLTHGKSKNEAFFAAREKLKNYSGKFKITATKFSQTRQANVTVEKEITVNFNSPYYYSAFILNDGI